MDISSLKTGIEESLREYLFSSDPLEVARRLQVLRTSGSLGRDDFSVEIVKRCVYLILEGTREQGEALTALLSTLEIFGAITYVDLQRGIAVMEQRLQDIQLDFPRAADVLAGVLAWLVVDNAIAESFLTLEAGGGGPRPLRVRALRSLQEGAHYVLQVRSMYRDLVRAFFASCAVSDLAAAIVRLHARHTTPEVVVWLIQLAIVDAGATSDDADFRCELASGALRVLCESGVLSREAVLVGFLRLLRLTCTIAAERTDAVARVAKFIVRAIADSVLPATFITSGVPAALTADPEVAEATSADVPPPPPHPRLTNSLSRSISAERAPDGNWVVAQLHDSVDAAALMRGDPGTAAARSESAVTVRAVLEAAVAASRAAAEDASGGRVVWGWRGPPLPALVTQLSAASANLVDGLRALAAAPASTEGPALEAAAVGLEHGFAAAVSSAAAPFQLQAELVFALLARLCEPPASTLVASLQHRAVGERAARAVAVLVSTGLMSKEAVPRGVSRFLAVAEDYFDDSNDAESTEDDARMGSTAEGAPIAQVAAATGAAGALVTFIACALLPTEALTSVAPGDGFIGKLFSAISGSGSV